MSSSLHGLFSPNLLSLRSLAYAGRDVKYEWFLARCDCLHLSSHRLLYSWQALGHQYLCFLQATIPQIFFPEYRFHTDTLTTASEASAKFSSQDSWKQSPTSSSCWFQGRKASKLKILEAYWHTHGSKTLKTKVWQLCIGKHFTVRLRLGDAVSEMQFSTFGAWGVQRC